MVSLLTAYEPEDSPTTVREQVLLSENLSSPLLFCLNPENHVFTKTPARREFYPLSSYGLTPIQDSFTDTAISFETFSVFRWQLHLWQDIPSNHLTAHSLPKPEFLDLAFQQQPHVYYRHRSC